MKTWRTLCERAHGCLQGKERDLKHPSFTGLRRHRPANTLDLDFWPSVRQFISIVSATQSGTLLWQPVQRNTVILRDSLFL